MSAEAGTASISPAATIVTVATSVTQSASYASQSDHIAVNKAACADS